MPRRPFALNWRILRPGGVARSETRRGLYRIGRVGGVGIGVGGGPRQLGQLKAGDQSADLARPLQRRWHQPSQEPQCTEQSRRPRRTRQNEQYQGGPGLASIPAARRRSRSSVAGRGCSVIKNTDLGEGKLIQRREGDVADLGRLGGGRERSRMRLQWFVEREGFGARSPALLQVVGTGGSPTAARIVCSRLSPLALWLNSLTTRQRWQVNLLMAVHTRHITVPSSGFCDTL